VACKLYRTWGPRRTFECDIDLIVGWIKTDNKASLALGHTMISLATRRKSFIGSRVPSAEMLFASSPTR